MDWPEKLRQLFQPRKSSQDSALYEGETGQERIIAILRENPVVDGQGEVAATLYDRGAFQGFSKGEDLILQGANDDDVYFLLFGEVDILIDKKWRAKRVAPNQVGEMAALDAGMPRSATVRAKTDAVYAWKVPAQNFNELFVADGKAALRIRRELSSRHREQLAWKPARDGLKSFALWSVISLLVAVLCAAIAWTTTAFLPFGEIERAVTTGGTALLFFIFTMLLNPAFLWRRLISYVLLGWAGLFVMDWTIAAKMKNGSEETEVSLVSSGLDLDWTILTPIAIVSVVLIGIFAVFEHKRMEG
ncbi:cyclic nucleotide-binding domain-containing protein [Parasphingorhabdus sp.]|uniref:cyclic nucleotide-binding domain-containing protein n=1 Tax=Parasphingorhabdus sp. TaxID=2709688 RepID=UPI003BAEBF99